MVGLDTCFQIGRVCSGCSVFRPLEYPFRVCAWPLGLGFVFVLGGFAFGGVWWLRVVLLLGALGWLVLVLLLSDMAHLRQQPGSVAFGYSFLPESDLAGAHPFLARFMAHMPDGFFYDVFDA